MNVKQVISALDAGLEPIGFTRRKSVWNRRIDDVVEVIDVQVSTSGDTVTVNAGVLDPTVHEAIWGEEPPKFVEEPLSTVRARIGELLDRKDRWWQLGSEQAVGEIVDTVTQVVLPFLQRMHHRGEMASWLDRAEVVKRRQHAEILGLAVLKNLVGGQSEACELLAAQRKRAIGAWLGRYDEVAQRLRCGSGGKVSHD
jgi:hypothetical protein